MEKFLVLLVLSIFTAQLSFAFDGPPMSEGRGEGPGPGPGMGEGPGGPRPGMMEDGPDNLKNIKFEYDVKNGIFKSKEEASEYQALYEANKDSKDIKDFFEKISAKKKAKMEEMQKSDKRPDPSDFSKMQEQMEAEKIVMIKDLKALLDKTKKDKEKTVLASAGQVKCEADKKAPVLEKATTDSIKDATKVAKIVMSEEEFAKMKADIKEEVRKELMKDMAKNGPEMGGMNGASKDKKPSFSKDSDSDDGPSEKMASNKRGGMGGMKSGGDAPSFSMSSSASMPSMPSMSSSNNMNMNMNQAQNTNSQMMASQQQGSTQANYQQMNSVMSNGFQINGTPGGMNNNSMMMGNSQMQMRPQMGPQIGISYSQQAYGSQSNFNQNYGFFQNNNNQQMQMPPMPPRPMGQQNQNGGYNFMTTSSNVGYNGNNNSMAAYYGYDQGQYVNPYQMSTSNYQQQYYPTMILGN
jgi:hypothetical protein